MSLHPSLRVNTAGSQQRTVLSRIERIKDLMKKGLWFDTHAVTDLPKTKIVKVKARKTKVKAEEAKGKEVKGKEVKGKEVKAKQEKNPAK